MGKSLNQTVLDYIQQATKLDMQDDANDTFDWIIGANTLEDTSLQAIAEINQIDKLKSRI